MQPITSLNFGYCSPQKLHFLLQWKEASLTHLAKALEMDRRLTRADITSHLPEDEVIYGQLASVVEEAKKSALVSCYIRFPGRRHVNIISVHSYLMSLFVTPSPSKHFAAQLPPLY